MKRVRAHAAKPKMQSAQRRATDQTAHELTLLDCILDEALFAPWFKKHPGSWAAWITFICALFCLPMTKQQLAIYRQCTGRDEPPKEIAKLAFVIVGRRGGKTLILSLIATYLACFHDFRQYLAPGERGVVQLIASDKKQAKQLLRYISGFFEQIPLLSKLLERSVAETFDLTNRITIEVTTASMKATRGFTVVCSILDEAAHFSTDEGSSSPDSEILAAIIPATLTIPNALILVSSSPYARRGILYAAYRDYFGKPERDRTLVWKAGTTTMNPSVDASFIAREYEKDPVSAASEYGAEFRNDIENYVDLDAVMLCVSEGIGERGRKPDIDYVGAIDPAGGSGKDSLTIAVAHQDKASGHAVLDLVAELKPPFSPAVAVERFSEVFKSFGISKIVGDHWGGDFVKEPFKIAGIEYELSKKAKSEIYSAFLPLINSRKVDLLDNNRLIQQLVQLEQRVARSGRSQIDHPPGAHDDLINAAAIALVNCIEPSGYDADLYWVTGRVSEEESNRAWRGSQLAQFMSTPQIWSGNKGRRY